MLQPRIGVGGCRLDQAFDDVVDFLIDVGSFCERCFERLGGRVQCRPQRVNLLAGRLRGRAEDTRHQRRGFFGRDGIEFHEKPLQLCKQGAARPPSAFAHVFADFLYRTIQTARGASDGSVSGVAIIWAWSGGSERSARWFGTAAG